MSDIAELLRIGRDIEQRINLVRCSPADRAGERVKLRGRSHLFLWDAREALEDSCSQMVEPSCEGLGTVTLEELQELLRLTIRIGRELASGFFES